MNGNTCRSHDLDGNPHSDPADQPWYDCSQAWLDYGVCPPGCTWSETLEENSFLDDWLVERGSQTTEEDDDHPSKRLPNFLTLYGIDEESTYFVTRHKKAYRLVKDNIIKHCKYHQMTARFIFVFYFLSFSFMP